MTHAQLTEAVRARELLAPSTSERRDEGGHHLVHGGATRSERLSLMPTRVHASGGEERGCDPRPPASTTRPCPNEYCVEGEVFFRHRDFDPQTEDSYLCPDCGGAGTVPVPRQIPDSRRAA